MSGPGNLKVRQLGQPQMEFSLLQASKVAEFRMQLLLPKFQALARDREEAKERIESVVDGIIERMKNFEFVGNVKIARLLRLLDVMHGLLTRDAWTTKRDVYYQDVALFEKQSVVNACVEQVARSLAIPKRLLHVSAGGKGLAKGPIEVWLKDGTRMTGEFLIPAVERIERVEWQGKVLVVEKEAIFKRLSSKRVVMTGKGYPDYATIDLVKLCSRETAASVLVDGDVYGMEIFQMYHKHANVQLLGLGFDDWPSVADGIVVGQRDILRGMRILTSSASSASSENSVGESGRFSERVIREVAKLVHARCKVELEVLGDDLEVWVDFRLPLDGTDSARNICCPLSTSEKTRPGSPQRV